MISLELNYNKIENHMYLLLKKSVNSGVFVFLKLFNKTIYRIGQSEKGSMRDSLRDCGQSVVLRSKESLRMVFEWSGSGKCK